MQHNVPQNHGGDYKRRCQLSYTTTLDSKCQDQAGSFKLVTNASAGMRWRNLEPLYALTRFSDPL